MYHGDMDISFSKKNRRFKHQSITISLQRYTALAAALTAALATALADAALGTAHDAAVLSLASLARRVGRGTQTRGVMKGYGAPGAD